ncbi:hypothetical protein GCM10007862_20850 [Dyella lipolytica]|uniref:DUF58 domain-containing protein n=1 Tax=Dyella lipolytica TaxID=1867835 RepID=A0ABW8IQZ3_9GAMM|nr:DUF58 domain-containing protein [Dyella lipolytica]GLQ47034.1 hypothetical protein GCM10007862_20850 [Dyella lipolytica]
MRPSSLLLWLLFGWVLVGVLASLAMLPLAAWLAYGGALALVALFDAWRLARRPAPELQRDVAPVVPLGLEMLVRMRLRSIDKQAYDIEVHDLHPGGWIVRGLPYRLQLASHEECAFDYALMPGERGLATFAGCHLRIRSSWRLWRQRRTLGTVDTVRVYPNFAPLAKMAGLSVELATHVAGARLQRRRGEGTEFQELRDYRVGDSLRKIDWKATARVGHFISREYREERNQQIVLLIDCGRRMLAKDGAISHFDHVLNASLSLAYIAMRQGDAVGMLACTGRTQRWLPPQRGSGGMDMLLGAGYDLQAMPTPTDYLAAANALQERQRRRSLVILITNVRDEDDTELAMAVTVLAQRHLVLVASLREGAVEQVASNAGESLETAIRSASAMHYLAERERVHDNLNRHGVMTMDVGCSELSGALIERYLRLKRENRL